MPIFTTPEFIIIISVLLIWTIVFFRLASNEKTTKYAVVVTYILDVIAVISLVHLIL